MSDTTTPFFSVVVPTYNQAKYLPAALDSLLAQTDPAWEAVVVDDGSSDGTAEVIREYVRRDPRVRSFHKNNGGAATALNLGIQEARGDWVCWLSSDDLYHSHKLASHRAAMLRHPEGWFFFTEFESLYEATGEIHDGRDLVPIPSSFELPVLDMLERGYVCGITTCVKREAFERVGLFDPQSRYGQDYDMYVRLASVFRPILVPESTCFYRQHSAQGAATRTQEMFWDIGMSAVKFLNSRDLEGMTPGVDWDDPSAVEAVIDRAMDVATNPYSYLYGIGPHFGLIGRIAEWLWRTPTTPLRRRLRAEFGRQARAGTVQRATPLGTFWRGATVFAEAARPGAVYQPVDLPGLVQGRYDYLTARRDPKADELCQYYRRLTGTEPLLVTRGLAKHHGAAIVRCGGGETVRRLVQEGYEVLAIQPGAGSLKMAGASPCIEAPEGISQWLGLAAAAPWDLVVSGGNSSLLDEVLAPCSALVGSGGELTEPRTVRWPAPARRGLLRFGKQVGRVRRAVLRLRGRQGTGWTP